MVHFMFPNVVSMKLLVLVALVMIAQNQIFQEFIREIFKVFTLTLFTLKYLLCFREVNRFLSWLDRDTCDACYCRKQILNTNTAIITFRNGEFNCFDSFLL